MPMFDEIILHMGLMNKIISLDDVSGKIELYYLLCKKGIILPQKFKGDGYKVEEWCLW